MSKNKKPVLVERKVQVAEPDPNGLDSETNAVTFFLVANTVIFSFAQLIEFSAAEPSFFSLIGMAIFNGIILAIYLPEKKKWKETYSKQRDMYNEDCDLCRKENENRKETSYEKSSPK